MKVEDNKTVELENNMVNLNSKETSSGVTIFMVGMIIIVLVIATAFLLGYYVL